LARQPVRQLVLSSRYVAEIDPDEAGGQRQYPARKIVVLESVAGGKAFTEHSAHVVVVGAAHHVGVSAVKGDGQGSKNGPSLRIVGRHARTAFRDCVEDRPAPFWAHAPLDDDANSYETSIPIVRSIRRQGVSPTWHGGTSSERL
jgi:hypothetical protein